MTYYPHRCDQPPGMCPFCYKNIVECNCWQGKESRRTDPKVVQRLQSNEELEYARFKRFMKRYIEEDIYSLENEDGDTDSIHSTRGPLDKIMGSSL